MTQDEKWRANWREVMDFMESNKRRPSKFVDEERGLRNWWKHQQKLVNAGELRPEGGEVDNCRLSSRLDKVRVNSALCSLFRKFKKLLEMTEQYRRNNNKLKLLI